MASLIGNTAVLRSLKPTDFVDETFGLPTVTDILRELEKPGRDPRPAFKTATFKEGVEKIGDLASGMVLEGVVTNVAAFGAFVDVGVHQDGLVHVSAMSKTFVKDPRDVVKPGDIVKVKVLDVDIPRKRISLTLRLDDEAARPAAGRRSRAARRRERGGRPPQQRPGSGGRGRASAAGPRPGGGGARGGARQAPAAGRTARWRTRCGGRAWSTRSGGSAESRAAGPRARRRPATGGPAAWAASAHESRRRLRVRPSPPATSAARQALRHLARRATSRRRVVWTASSIRRSWVTSSSVPV